MKIQKLRRTTAFLTAAIILASALTGCNTAAPSGTPDTPAISAAPATQEKFTPRDDTLIMSVNGSPVYWSEYRYWLNYSLQYSGYTSGSEIDWSSPVADNLTLEEYIKNDAANAVALYRVIDQTAERLNITLSEEDNEEIASIIQANKSYFETEEEYNAYLKDNYLSEELMQYLLEASSRYYQVFIKLYGENGELLPESEAILYGNENGYFRAKHILISFTDENEEARSDEVMQEKTELLADILNRLGESEDPAALFDELMLEYSEDPGLAYYPDGYQFVRGDMVDEFQEAIEELGDYEYSGIVTMSDYGYTIIMRLPLNPDEAALSDSYGYSLRYTAASLIYQSLADTWTSEASIEYSEAYYKISTDDWFLNN